MPRADEVEQRAGEASGKPSRWLAVPLTIFLLVVAGFALYVIYQQHVAAPKNPSFVDDIVDESLVIWGARLALLFGATYAAVSMVGLMRGQRWLTKIGPLGADPPGIDNLSREAEDTQEALHSALATIDTVEARLRESDIALEEARADYRLLVARLDSIQDQKESA
jgi:hypothetical protein